MGARYQKDAHPGGRPAWHGGQKAYLVTIVIVELQTIVRIALELDYLAAQLRQNVLRCTSLVPAASATFGASSSSNMLPPPRLTAGWARGGCQAWSATSLGASLSVSDGGVLIVAGAERTAPPAALKLAKLIYIPACQVLRVECSGCVHHPAIAVVHVSCVRSRRTQSTRCSELLGLPSPRRGVPMTPGQPWRRAAPHTRTATRTRL